jgi:hypothetical protein
MPGNSKFDGKGQRKFIRNMAAGGAIGATAGSAGAKLLTRGRSKFRPIRSAAIGGAAAGGVGVGMVSHKRRSKVKKNMTVSAFGVDHGRN